MPLPLSIQSNKQTSTKGDLLTISHKPLITTNHMPLPAPLRSRALYALLEDDLDLRKRRQQLAERLEERRGEERMAQGQSGSAAAAVNSEAAYVPSDRWVKIEDRQSRPA